MTYVIYQVMRKEKLLQTLSATASEGPVMLNGCARVLLAWSPLCRQLYATLQHARPKSAMGSLTNVFEFRQVNRGRSISDVKGARPRRRIDWRSFRSSPRWGKPITWRREAVQVCLLRRLSDHSEVKTFDNQ